MGTLTSFTPSDSHAYPCLSRFGVEPAEQFEIAENT